MRTPKQIIIIIIIIIVTFIFSINSVHYGPGFDSASNRNEYQEYFMVGGGGQV